MVRISGLVHAYHRVREQLRRGIPEGEAPVFRRRVEQLIAEVEAICARHDVKPDALPAPSRNAYYFLKRLDVSKLPVVSSDQPPRAPRGEPIRIKNLVRKAEYLAQLLAQKAPEIATSPESKAKIRQDMNQVIAEVDRLCANHHGTAAQLELPSRNAYGWMKFLLVEQNLNLHVTALLRARKVATWFPWPADHPLIVLLVNMSGVYNLKRYSNATLLKCSEGFLHADEQVWKALFARIQGDRSESTRQTITDFLASEDFTDVLFELAALDEGGEAITQGRVYDLDEVFARVNAVYFAGRMPKPRLQWNQTLTMHKFGHYRPSRDTIMISLSLDDERVPAYAIEFVMYHELLHKKHDAITSGGRRIAHTPAFREEERRFRDYEAAQRAIRELALEHRGFLPTIEPGK